MQLSKEAVDTHKFRRFQKPTNMLSDPNIRQDVNSLCLCKSEQTKTAIDTSSMIMSIIRKQTKNRHSLQRHSQAQKLEATSKTNPSPVKIRLL